MLLSLFSALGLAFASAVLATAWWSVQRVPPFRIAGCRALVTGGSTGIGLETARELVRGGAKVVVIAARRVDVLRAAAEVLRKEAVLAKGGTQVFSVGMDVTDEESVARAMREIETIMTGGAGLDLVACNAGLAVPTRFVDTTSEDVRRMMEVNFFGCVNVARVALPAMLRRRYGRIVFVSSLAARCPIAGYSSYAASKAAVRAFAHSLDMENSCLGVRCQIVCPPDVETPGLQSENLHKSPECKAISSYGGNVPHTAESMAKSIIKSIQHYRFDTSLGCDGVLLSWGSAGIEPPTSVMELLLQFLFSGWLRLAMAVFSKLHYGIVQHVRSEEAATKKVKDMSLGGRARGLILVASAAAVGGGGLFACRDSSIGGASGPLWNRRQQSTVPLFDASAVERVEEHAHYPCKAFPGYSVVVTNYYTCLPDDDPSFISKGKSNGGIFRRLFALFSNETHTVVEHGDPEACENQLHRVREVVGDAKLPASRTEASSSSSSSSIPAMGTPFVASSMWPPGTAKYAAMTIQPSSSSSLPVVSDSGEPVGVLRRLADRTTHQSLIRCDPFAPSSTNCIGDASYLGAPYLRIMLSAFLLLPSPLPRLRVAVLGVGGGSLPSFLQRYFSREMSRLDLVDAEPQCFYAAVEDLGLRNTMQGGVMKCHVSDAAEFLENTAGSSGGTVAVVSGTRPSGTSPVLLDDTVDSVESRQRAQRYDVLFVDLFLGSEPPSFLSSMQFLRLCHGVLSSFGVAAFNLPASDPDFLKRCHQVFGRGNVFQIPVPASANVVVLARRAVGGGGAVENNLHISHRHFYRRAKALQKSHALPYDLAGHYPLWWRLW